MGRINLERMFDLECAENQKFWFFKMLDSAIAAVYQLKKLFRFENLFSKLLLENAQKD